MKACVIQPWYSFHESDTDLCFNRMLELLDQCDESMDLIVLPEYGDVPAAQPDKEHFHHQLLKLKFTPRVSVLIIYAINIVFAIVSILFVLHNRQIAVFIYTLLLLLLLFLVLKTDILFDHSKKKEVKNGIQRNGRKNSKKTSRR